MKEILLTITDDIDFVMTKDKFNSYFFSMRKGEKVLHLTIALQQWLRERATEWEERDGKES